MTINDFSTLGEIVQAIAGTWDLTIADDWKCLELGKVRLYKKLVHGHSPLPDKFIGRRTEISPYIVFRKDAITGGAITLQDTAIKADGLVVILQF